MQKQATCLPMRPQCCSASVESPSVATRCMSLLSVSPYLFPSTLDGSEPRMSWDSVREVAGAPWLTSAGKGWLCGIPEISQERDSAPLQT